MLTSEALSVQAQFEWLTAGGVPVDAASACVAGFYSTFQHASAKSSSGFQHLVDEQTPGGINEKVEYAGFAFRLKLTITGH